MTILKNNRGLVRVAVGQLGAAFVGAAFWLVMAFMLHPVAYGHLSYLVSIGMLISVFTVLGWGKTIATYYPKEGKKELLSGPVVIVLAASLLAGAITSLVLEPAVGLLIIGFSLFSLAVYSDLGEQNYTRYMWMWLGVRFASFTLAIAIYLWWGMVNGIVAGLAIAYLIFGSRILRHFRINPPMKEVQGKMGFAFTTLGADASTGAVNLLDKILIGLYFGVGMLGFYQLAYRIFVALTIIPKILLFYLLPEKSAGRSTRGVEIVGILASVGLAALTIILVPMVIPQLFPDFTESIPAIQIMGLAAIPATIAGTKTSELYAREEAKVVLAAHLVALGVGVAGIMFLGESFGLLGLAVSMLILQITLAASLTFIPRLFFRGGVPNKIAIGTTSMALAAVLLLSYLHYQPLQIEIMEDKVRGTGIAMGTVVAITVVHEKPEDAEAAIGEAFEEIKRIERLMSVRDEASEIYALNRGGTDWVKLSPEVLYVLETAQYYSNLSGGAFDVTVQPLMELWMEKTRERGQMPIADELSEALELVGWNNLILDRDNTRARFIQYGMGVTLGGIAQGYGVDRAIEILMERGMDSALVEIGGDIRVFGTKNWRIAVQHPRANGQWLEVIELKDGAIVTSGDYAKYFFLGGRRVHHLIDPRTGYPADKSISVTIIADNAIAADALSTAVFVLGPKEGAELLSSLGVQGLIVAPDGEVTRTEAWNFSVVASRH
jgi:thiamine biosynthesis lipoprotein